VRAPVVPVSGASRASAAPAPGPSASIRRDGTGLQAGGGAARPEPAATGGIKIVILPWAEVWIDGKAMGQTPLRTTLPVGPHRVRLKSDTRDKTINITVTASRVTVIDESW
jgi:hypothetical protein